MRVNVRHFLFLSLLTSACSADTGLTSPSAERDIIADRLARVADSISVESSEVAAEPYRALAELVRRTEHPSVVSLRVDGEALPFSAVGFERVVDRPCDASTASDSSGSADTSRCVRSTRFRALLAWHAPSRRLLMLTSSAEHGTFDGEVGERTSVGEPVAQLRFFDQSDRAGWAIAGSYTSSVRTAGDCPPMGSIDRDGEAARCLRARFLWQLDAQTARRGESRDGAPPSIVTHTLTLAPAEVDGGQWTFTAAAAPPSASPLAAALRTRVDSVVSLALIVRNESGAPITLRFPSSQQYEFEIRDRGGKTVWRWSDGQTFSDAPTTRAIPSRESITFPARWPPSVHGELIVVATMTSATQRVSARAALTVP